MRNRVLLTGTLLLICAGAAIGEDDGSGLVGRWTGDSICVGDRPACKNESVVYRIAKPPDRSGNVRIEADKIVGGSVVNMGAIDFKYDREAKTLTGQIPIGVWRFTVADKAMEGTLTLMPENTVMRRVKLAKESPARRSS